MKRKKNSVQDDDFDNFDDDLDEIEEVNEKTEKKPKTETVKVKGDAAYTLLAFISFVTFWVSLLIFMVGAVDVNGETINVVSAINLVLDLFSIKLATLYETLANTVLAVMYIVILIKLIYNVISVIRLFVQALRGDSKIKRNSAAIDVYYDLIDTFLTYYVILFASFVLTGSTLNVCAVMLIALNIIICIIAAVIRPVEDKDEKYTVLDGVVDTIRKIVMLFAFCLVFAVIAEPVGIEILNGGKLLYNVIYNPNFGVWGIIVNIYSAAARPVLILIIMILLLYSFHCYTEYVFPKKSGTMASYSYSAKASAITILVLICVVAVLDLLFLYGEYDGELSVTAATFENWFRVSKNTLIPAVLAAIGVVIVSSPKGKTVPKI